MAKITVEKTGISIIQASIIYADEADVLINDNIPQNQRLLRLNKIAIQQMTILVEVQGRKLLK
jgi:hypothetical protein